MSVLDVLNRIFIKPDYVSSPEDLDLKSVQDELTGKDKELARKLDIWVVKAEQAHEAQLAENIPEKKATVRANALEDTKVKGTKSKEKNIENNKEKKTSDYEIAD